MCKIINFTAVLNARRAAAEHAERKAKKQAAKDQRRQTGYEQVGHDPAQMMIVDAVCAAKEAQEAKEEAARPSVAYCDPANEFQGCKYSATRHMSLAEIAKLIRKDIKEAKKRGDVPTGVKVSVRTRTYSGGGAIDVRIQALPEGMKLHNDEFLRRVKAGENTWAFSDRYTEDFTNLKAALTQIHNAYNRDDSDIMTDYFDVRYYGHVELDGDLRRDFEKREGIKQ